MFEAGYNTVMKDLKKFRKLFQKKYITKHIENDSIIDIYKDDELLEMLQHISRHIGEALSIPNVAQHEEARKVLLAIQDRVSWVIGHGNAQYGVLYTLGR